jgi:hypothetical protein
MNRHSLDIRPSWDHLACEYVSTEPQTWNWTGRLYPGLLTKDRIYPMARTVGI